MRLLFWFIPLGYYPQPVVFEVPEAICPTLDQLHLAVESLGDAVVARESPHAGDRCDPVIKGVGECLQWGCRDVRLSAGTNLAIGRHDSKGNPLTVIEYARLLEEAASLGIRTKVNTVVNRHNHHENLSDFLNGSGIARWKVLQVMAVGGQNDAYIDALSITRAEFDAFIDRHRSVESAGIAVVPEPVTSIRGSYCMIDPRGRFFDSTRGSHQYSRPILEAGIDSAFREVSFDVSRFSERGGDYDFNVTADIPTSPDIPRGAVGVTVA